LRPRLATGLPLAALLYPFAADIGRR